MRVSCNTVESFLTNLRADCEGVYRRVVYVNVNSRCLDTSLKNQVRWEISFQASTVVNTEDGGQYLLEFGVIAGLDYRDSTQELRGTEEASRLRTLVEDTCDDLGLRVRPGLVSE